MSSSEADPRVVQEDIPLYINDDNFNEYKFKEIIGIGGQGTVCIYEETSTREKFAVKFDPKNGGG